MRIILLITLYIYSVSLIAQNSTGYSTGKDVNVYYEEFGEGNPLLLINGGPGMSSRGFQSLAKEITNRLNLRVIIFDQRGTGNSKIEKMDAESFTMTKLVEDIEKLRIHLKIDDWVVMGHSFGGMLASAYTSVYPESVSKLILSSSGGMDLGLFSLPSLYTKLTSEELDSLNYYSNKITQGDTTYQTKLKRGRILAPIYLSNQEFVEPIAHRLTESNMQVNQLVWQDLRKIDFDCKNELKSFKKPVLIINGEYDIIDKSIALSHKKVMPQSEIIFIHNAAHYGWLENPKQYFGSIANFLN